MLCGTLFLLSCKEGKDPIDGKIEALISQMTVEEKVGQLSQLHLRDITPELKNQVKEGRYGSFLNVANVEEYRDLQRIAVEDSRLGIPILFARDVIHGFKTIFPIPLGMAATFNPDLIQKGSEIAAQEATSVGIRWTFAPMVDISHDPRWGRIAESFGEDPYLSAQMAIASVKGFQGQDLSDPTSMAACAKHFVGYGAAEGGRDYNTANITERQLRNLYLPPFEAATKAGMAAIMTSFNDIDGVPSTANEFLLRTVLRDEWKFDGVVVSDWEATSEIIAHGFAADGKEVAMECINAGLDMEMYASNYAENLETLLQEGKVKMETIDEAVRNVLRLKYRLGLFDNPYGIIDKGAIAYREEDLNAAKETSIQSVVLLKNEAQLLPLKNIKKLALIGPMVHAPHDQLGTWVFDGEKEKTITPLMAIKDAYGKDIEIIYEPGLDFSRDRNTAGFSKALAAAQKADVSVVFLGEEAILSGEAHNLSNINLIGMQSELLQTVKKAGKPVVLVIMAGRPLTIEKEINQAGAVLYSFHPGTMGGEALADLLFGKANPSGKLPVTFVREVGQIPMYYNHFSTGRPSPDDLTADVFAIPLEAIQGSVGSTSFYLDSGIQPLFPFGYGLSYTTFTYSNLQLSQQAIPLGSTLLITADITNDGSYDGTEVVQLYVQDITGSITRPVKELKGFKRVALKAGESKRVQFELSTDDLAFYGLDMKRKTEPGKFNVWVGTNSMSGLKTMFEVN